jgi:hypothetical protein
LRKPLDHKAADRGVSGPAARRSDQRADRRRRVAPAYGGCSKARRLLSGSLAASWARRPISAGFRNNGIEKSNKKHDER